MVEQFFLRDIIAHLCMALNVSRGSASAMRRLRQEACDLEEAPAADSRALDLLPRQDDFFIGANYMDHVPVSEQSAHSEAAHSETDKVASCDSSSDLGLFQ